MFLILSPAEIIATRDRPLSGISTIFLLGTKQNCEMSLRWLRRNFSRFSNLCIRGNDYLGLIGKGLRRQRNSNAPIRTVVHPQNDKRVDQISEKGVGRDRDD